ncbi:endoribonuclease YicC domain-containing protein [Azospirillum melinis]|uniref:endoribonuclease YicC domain-containing protein n=1 Tax=Azospirillum melinis TaxID=328839 RepID=UPI0037583CF5
MKGDLSKLIDQLAVNRLAEGARIAEVLNGHLDEIARLVDAASACASTQPEALREKLRTQVAAILGSFPALSEERLAQEAAILIGKADVREELDRLRAHIQAARDMMAEGGAIGRRFDFLCQEFNREANTLCSKSADVELTRIGLSLKASIEQLREQVQNIE